jgi:hypothetical protein
MSDDEKKIEASRDAFGWLDQAERREFRAAAAVAFAVTTAIIVAVVAVLAVLR